MRTITVVSIIMLSACGPMDEVESLERGLSSDTSVIHNFNGEKRYVKVNQNEVKLFLTSQAEANDDPKQGFANSNHFTKSCGPTAAYNVFNWYGIVALEGQTCFWIVEEGKLSRPPIWVCRDRITPQGLGYEMKTNSWTLFTIPMKGTKTSNFRAVFKKYVERHMPADYAYQYKYEEGVAQAQYNNIWATLAQGNPVVVNYKTGSTRGHFAVIVGIEKAGSATNIFDDRIIMANARDEDLTGAMSYSRFHELWRRDYTDFNLLQLVGERRYTRINLWDTTQPDPPPPPGGGGGGGGDQPPLHQK
jgi:hypothetical protein